MLRNSVGRKRLKGRDSYLRKKNRTSGAGREGEGARKKKNAAKGVAERDIRLNGRIAFEESFGGEKKWVAASRIQGGILRMGQFRKAIQESF